MLSFYRNYANLGWEKCSIPESFVNFMDRLVLKRSSGPRSPRAKGGWETVMSNHLHNRRTALWNFIGKDARTQYEWLQIRYQNKAEWFEAMWVS